MARAVLPHACACAPTRPPTQVHISVDLPHDPTRIYRLVPLLGEPSVVGEDLVDGMAELVTRGRLLRFGCRLNYYTDTVKDLMQQYFKYRGITDGDEAIEEAAAAPLAIADVGGGDAEAVAVESKSGEADAAAAGGGGGGGAEGVEGMPEPKAEDKYVLCEVRQGYDGIRISVLDRTTRLRTLMSNAVPPLLLRRYVGRDSLPLMCCLLKRSRGGTTGAGSCAYFLLSAPPMHEGMPSRTARQSRRHLPAKTVVVRRLPVAVEAQRQVRQPMTTVQRRRLARMVTAVVVVVVIVVVAEMRLQ